MELCCGATVPVGEVGNCKKGPNQGVPPCHCFIRVTTAGRKPRTIADYHGLPTNVTQYVLRCCWPSECGFVPGAELVCARDEGAFAANFDGLNCTPMGPGKCIDICNCLEKQLDWCNNAGPHFCYGECTPPNSNTIAFHFGSTCGAVLQPPAAPPNPPPAPIAPAACGAGTPGYELFEAGMYEPFCLGGPGHKQPPR